MPCVPLKNKNNYTVNASHNHICTVTAPLSVPRHQICTVRWGRGFSRKKKNYDDGIQTKNLLGSKPKMTYIIGGKTLNPLFLTQN